MHTSYCVNKDQITATDCLVGFETIDSEFCGHCAETSWRKRGWGYCLESGWTERWPGCGKRKGGNRASPGLWMWGRAPERRWSRCNPALALLMASVPEPVIYRSQPVFGVCAFCACEWKRVDCTHEWSLSRRSHYFSFVPRVTLLSPFIVCVCIVQTACALMSGALWPLTYHACPLVNHSCSG